MSVPAVCRNLELLADQRAAIFFNRSSNIGMRVYFVVDERSRRASSDKDQFAKECLEKVRRLNEQFEIAS